MTLNDVCYFLLLKSDFLRKWGNFKTDIETEGLKFFFAILLFYRLCKIPMEILGCLGRSLTNIWCWKDKIGQTFISEQIVARNVKIGVNMCFNSRILIFLILIYS